MAEKGAADERWLALPGLRAVRRARLLSRPELAKAARVALRTIVYLETGGARARPATVRKLMIALNATVGQLMGTDKPPAGGPADGGNDVPPGSSQSGTSREG